MFGRDAAIRLSWSAGCPVIFLLPLFMIRFEKSTDSWRERERGGGGGGGGERKKKRRKKERKKQKEKKKDTERRKQYKRKIFATVMVEFLQLPLSCLHFYALG